jgi:hypothetical protein
MDLKQARELAQRVEAGGDAAFKREAVADINTAFHKLDRSDPATLELRKGDIFLARLLWRATGRNGKKLAA